MTLRSPRPFRPPSKADTLYATGTRLAEAGRLEEAEQALRDAVRADPNHAAALHNLATVLDHLGRGEEAFEVYRRVIDLGVRDATVCYNIGSLLRRRGDARAAGYLRLALALQPDHAMALNSLGNVITDAAADPQANGEGGAAAERIAGAVALYRRALALEPELPIAHDNLGRALYLLHVKGDAGRAAALARAWLRDFPDQPVARHLGGALSGTQDHAQAGDGGEARAPDAYVRRAFDGFAGAFEATLASLGYRAPDLLAAAVARAGVTAGALALDAGCGTGWCAPWMRPLASRLTGVDLSAGMLERARARGLYDELVEAELTAYLTAHPLAFDLIVAADVLCYFGPLGTVLAAAGRALRPGGRLTFTVERWQGAGDHHVNPHGRYAHAESHVRGALAAAGLEVRDIAVDTLRQETGAPVVGFVVTAVKQSP